MAESKANKTQNIKPKTNKEKSKKRRFGGQQEGSRKKRKFEIDLTKERNIILCSCQKFKEKTCGRDLKVVFTEKIEEYLKSEKESTKNTKENKEEPKEESKEVKKSDTISVSDMIKNELSNLENNSVCEWIQGPDGLVVIDILNTTVKASKLLEFVFNQSHPNRPILSPFVYKLFPLDTTTFSRSDEIIALAQKVIQNIDWSKVGKEDTYAINYKNRGNKQLDRKTIIDSIAGFMSEDYSVDLTNPKTVILLQTFGRNAGISIITNGVFHAHKQYNLANFEL